MAEKKTEKTQLSETKLAQLNAQPVIESSVTRSKDWIIHKTIITDFKPVKYIEKVLENKDRE